MEVILHNNHFSLLPQRAIYWNEQKALILSDLHFGKTNHFRKAGIAVPEEVFNKDLRTLASIIEKFRPQQLIVVGDMFHSYYNKGIDQFSDWRNQYSTLHIHLIKGNHDILAESVYRQMDVRVDDEYSTGEFIFSHHCLEDSPLFCFSGHLHPGILLSGNARQSLRFPCFHFTASNCTLPAFSKFTGLAIINPGRGDKVFAIVGDDVVKV